MRLTFKEITARLAAIAELFAKIDHEHLLTDTPDFQKLKLRLRKLNNEILENISEEELKKFEQEACCQTILDHLDTAAVLYQITWNRPHAECIPQENCISWLSLQCDAFIQPFIKRIEEKKSATVGKQPTRIIDSDEPDNFALAVNQLLSLQLQELKLIFVKIKEEHKYLLLEQGQFKNATSTDLTNVKLIQWQNQYQKDSALGQGIIEKVSEKLSGLSFSNESFKEQGQLLSNSIESLKKLNTNRKELTEKIIAEQKLVFPDSEQSEQQLAALRLTALESLKKTLNSFVHFVIQIDAKNTGPEFHNFTEKLSLFVKNFINDLADGTPSIANNEAVGTLKRLLFNYVEGDSSFLPSTEKSNASSDTIDDLMNNLFSISTKETNENNNNRLLYSKQIERIYSICAKLQDPSIEKSAQYFCFQKNITQTRAIIDEKRNINKNQATQLQAKITSLVAELELRCKLIPFNTTLHEKAHERVNQLLELKTELSKVVVEIEDEISSLANSTNLYSLLKRFINPTSDAAFSQAFKEIVQLKESTNNKLTQQEKIHNYLEKIDVDFQDVNSILHQLDNFYEKELSKIHITLTFKITDTVLALQSLGWNNTQIDQTLKQQVDLSIEIISQNNPLTCSQDKVDEALISLDIIIAETKEKMDLRGTLQTKIANTALTFKLLGWDDKLIGSALQTQIDLTNRIYSKEMPLTTSQVKVEKALTYLDRIISETEEKIFLHNKLQVKIDAATSILELVGWNKDKIRQTLHAQHELDTEICSKNTTLLHIKTKVNEAITILDTGINEIEDSLHKDIVTSQETFQKRYFSLSDFARDLAHYGSHNIPIFNDLRIAIHDMDKQHRDYQEHILTFNISCSNAELKPWYNTYREKYRDIQKIADNCNELLIDAKKIEEEIKRRLHTPAYQVSQTILFDLQKEFNRILTKHIKHANKLSPDQKNALMGKDNLIFTTAYSEAVNKALEHIDPRLLKLKNIYSQFKKTNYDYIHNNHPSEATDHKKLDRAYINELQKQANKSLRSRDMEQISDGVRSGLTQWIRNHIVKPLQHLGRKNNFVFFPTKLACKTEKTLVEMGNDVYKQLTSFSG